jgi:hypothetical protein
MSRLSFYGRPWAVFDPALHEHRKYYNDFVITGTWGRCPVRFIVPDGAGDLITLIQRNLVKYYSEQEFVVKRTRKPRKVDGLAV